MPALTSELYGKTLNFTTISPALLGGGWTNVKLLSIVDYDTARRFSDILGKHVGLSPYLPAGTPNDYRQYYYAKLQRADDSIHYLGVPWIVESSVEVVVETDILVRIKGKSHDDLLNIRQALMAIGLEDFTVEIVGS